MNINIKNLNNYSIAKALFDEIAVYQTLKHPNQELDSFIGDIEKVLNQVQDKENNYKKGYDKGYDDGWDDGRLDK